MARGLEGWDESGGRSAQVGKKLLVECHDCKASISKNSGSGSKIMKQVVHMLTIRNHAQKITTYLEFSKCPISRTVTIIQNGMENKD